MVDVQTATVVIAGISVIIGVINSILSSRRADQQRQTQLFMQLYNQWTNPALVSSYGNVRYNERYNTWNSNAEALQKQIFEPFEAEMWEHHHTLINFFEGIGVLVQEGYIDINLVENLLSRRIIWCWEYYRSWVHYDRKRLNDPNVYDSLEYLYHEMKKREQLEAITIR